MAQTQISLRVGTIVRHKTSLYRVIGAGIGGAAGGRLMIQRKDERGLKLAKLVWTSDVEAVSPRASTSGEAPQHHQRRLASLDLAAERSAPHEATANHQGRRARARR